MGCARKKNEKDGDGFVMDVSTHSFRPDEKLHGYEQLQRMDESRKIVPNLGNKWS